MRYWNSQYPSNAILIQESDIQAPLKGFEADNLREHNSWVTYNKQLLEGGCL